MPNIRCRFVHSGDFRLDEPLIGLTELPEELRAALADAPFAAARAVFDAALAHDADFLLLAGNLLDPHRAGPRGLAFLHCQFERLRHKQIAVYWSPGEGDGAATWPASIEFPANVHRLDPRAAAVAHRREGVAIAYIGSPIQISAAEHLADATSSNAERALRIALARCPEGATALPAAPQVDYWALAGRRERRVLSAAPPYAVAAGSPQARGWGAQGSSCTLAEVDAAGVWRIAARPTDLVRFHELRITTEDCPSREAWERLLRERVEAIAHLSADRIVVLRIVLAAGGKPSSRTTRHRLAGEITQWLRERYYKAPLRVWTAAVVCPPAAAPAPLLDEESLRGEFLRMTRRAADGESVFAWRLPAGATALPEEVQAALLPDQTDRTAYGALIAEIAELGGELLSGSGGEAEKACDSPAV